MTTYYVGSGGNDSSAGTSWGARFLTISKAATVVAAGGDIVYVAPGTYREKVKLTVSGGNTYNTGTVTVTNGSATVTGSGTTFTVGMVGRYFKCLGAGTIKIAAYVSATEITLDYAYDGATKAGASYMIYDPIRWIGDYSGTNTDSVGGIVRITGSNDDIAVVRSDGFIATSVNYNHITGFSIDMISTAAVDLISCQYWLVEKCAGSYMSVVNGGYIYITGASQLHITVNACYFYGNTGSSVPSQVFCSHSSLLTNAYHVIQNCVFSASTNTNGGGFNSDRVSEIYLKNNTFSGCGNALQIGTALTSGRSNYAYNNILVFNAAGIRGTATSEWVEDYNTLWGNGNDRVGTNVGANTVAYPPLFDLRWWFELVK